MTNLLASILIALSAVESGDNDRAIGRAGELSRYQISVPVIAEYKLDSTRLKDYGYATEQAKRILSQRMNWFIKRYHRQPTGQETYLLWSRPSRCAKPRKIELARAERFNNLLNVMSKISKTGM